MIIDASVAFKWVSTEEMSERADALIGAAVLHAPSVMLAEVGNALWRKAMRGEFAFGQDFATHLGLVEGLVEIVDFLPFLPRAIEVAVALQHPIYDCIYLALAEAASDILVTADACLVAKVEQTAMATYVKHLRDV